MKIGCPSCKGCEDCFSIGYDRGKIDGAFTRRVKKFIRNAGFFGGIRYDRLRDRIFTGHLSLGRLTIYGANAMHYAVNFSTGKGYICARPTTGAGARHQQWLWYLYVSPDATPGSAWWGIGPGFDP